LKIQKILTTFENSKKFTIFKNSKILTTFENSKILTAFKNSNFNNFQIQMFRIIFAYNIDLVSEEVY